VRLEGLGQLKNPMTSSGLDPATFLLVACNVPHFSPLIVIKKKLNFEKHSLIRFVIRK
jgi:hypothetical protein